MNEKLKNIECIEYPKFEEIFMPKYSSISYVASDIAIAMINRLKNVKLFGIQRYCNEEEWQETFNNITAKKWGENNQYNTNIGVFKDDIYAFGETETSYVYVYLDHDVSDCAATIIPKKSLIYKNRYFGPEYEMQMTFEDYMTNKKDNLFDSLDEIIEAVKDQYFENNEKGHFEELPKINGLVSF